MVLEFCIENGVAITANFNKSQLKKSMYLQVSLEHTFSLVEPFIGYNPSYFNLIKKDLVNWNGQNQEHHAFDEGSLNFVHSKTSGEVLRIYDAIRFLECQLSQRQKRSPGRSTLPKLMRKLREARGRWQGSQKHQ